VNLKPFTGPGSTSKRRAFWDAARLAVLASQKKAGRNVTVDEHPGQGTVINVTDRTRVTTAVAPPGCLPENCPPTPMPCTLDLSVSTPNGYSVTQTGLLVASPGGACGDVTSSSAGWYPCEWFSCGNCSGCNSNPDSCQCGFSSAWITVPGVSPVGKWVIFDVNLFQGDPDMTPDGWWLSAAISDGTCYYGNYNLPTTGFCSEYFVRLGDTSSIFSTSLHVHADIHPDSFCADQADNASLDITFHPC
jgi:hypothetical protein